MPAGSVVHRDWWWRLRPRLPGVAAPGRGRLSGLAWFVPPPFRLLIQFVYLWRHLPGLVNLPPDVHAAEGALGYLAEQAAHPVRLRLAHRELVLGLDEQDPRQPLRPQF